MIVTAEAFTVDYDVTMATHSHARHQFTMAVRGSVLVETQGGISTVPSGRAVWIPQGVEHAERLHSGASLRTLYLDPAGPIDGVLTASHTVVVSPLLRELTARIAALGGLDARPAHVRLASVLLDEIAWHEHEPLDLATPHDPRALRLARMVEDTPADRSTVAELARRAGAGRRTMERVFMSELGMSVGAWRQRLRLHHALRLLADHQPIADVARATGYGSANAFILAFKRRFGVPPNKYRATRL